MPSERSSPSGGWREVYDAMDADASVEEPQPCCVCGRPSSVRVDGPYCRWHRPDRDDADGDGNDAGGRGDDDSADDRGREADGNGDSAERESNLPPLRSADRASRGRRDEGLARFAADGGDDRR